MNRDCAGKKCGGRFVGIDLGRPEVRFECYAPLFAEARQCQLERQHILIRNHRRDRCVLNLNLERLPGDGRGETDEGITRDRPGSAFGSHLYDCADAAIPGQVGRAGGGPMRKIYSQWCIPTPDRWQTAAKLFDRSNASPVDGD